MKLSIPVPENKSQLDLEHAWYSPNKKYFKRLFLHAESNKHVEARGT